MLSPTRPMTAADDRVPWNQLIAYGMGGMVTVALFNIAGQLIALLGNISLGLDPVWLGTIMIIPRLWDALFDPIMGHISDNTRGPWGRRRPYILLGGITVALTFVAMWWVPRGESIREVFTSEEAYRSFQLAYIFVSMLLFLTAITIFEIPHGALGLEMSGDYHERTRLFSAKSFLGNVFAMGTPWLLWLADLNFFRGQAGNTAEGMRYVSILIAAVLVPLSLWWFFSLREPGFAVARKQKKTTLWNDISTTVTNRTFLILVGVIFTLAMGFNFVGNFNNYIVIFYLYGGDISQADTLLGINGTIWAVTALVAVFPLNWISRRLGKSRTLVVAILLMCAAQLSKIVAYNPELPYLVFLPTILLSSGMLMFFTLGASMVGDICDEDELNTGTRNEGSYYSVYWWFIATGTAFASFVSGALLVYTAFDERQNVISDAVRSNIAAIKSDAETWMSENLNANEKSERVHAHIARSIDELEKLRQHFEERRNEQPDASERFSRLIQTTQLVRAQVEELRSKIPSLVVAPRALAREAGELLQDTTELKQQAPKTLLRLRLVEIGLPLALSCISILLTLGYPLTEARAYEIKQALENRRAEQYR